MLCAVAQLPAAASYGCTSTLLYAPPAYQSHLRSPSCLQHLTTLVLASRRRWLMALQLQPGRIHMVIGHVEEGNIPSQMYHIWVLLLLGSMITVLGKPTWTLYCPDMGGNHDSQQVTGRTRHDMQVLWGGNFAFVKGC